MAENERDDENTDETETIPEAEENPDTDEIQSGLSLFTEPLPHEEAAPSNKRTYGYVCFGVAVLSYAIYGLYPVIKIYALIVSILVSLTSLAFYNTQKKQGGPFPLAKAGQILGYIAFIGGLLILLGGLIYTGVTGD